MLPRLLPVPAPAPLSPRSLRPTLFTSLLSNCPSPTPPLMHATPPLSPFTSSSLTFLLPPLSSLFSTVLSPPPTSSLSLSLSIPGSPIALSPHRRTRRPDVHGVAGAMVCLTPAPCRRQSRQSLCWQRPCVPTTHLRRVFHSGSGRHVGDCRSPAELRPPPRPPSWHQPGAEGSASVPGPSPAYHKGQCPRDQMSPSPWEGQGAPLLERLRCPTSMRSWGRVRPSPGDPTPRQVRTPPRESLGTRCGLRPLQASAPPTPKTGFACSQCTAFPPIPDFSQICEGGARIESPSVRTLLFLTEKGEPPCAEAALQSAGRRDAAAVRSHRAGSPREKSAGN